MDNLNKKRTFIGGIRFYGIIVTLIISTFVLLFITPDEEDELRISIQKHIGITQNNNGFDYSGSERIQSPFGFYFNLPEEWSYFPRYRKPDEMKNEMEGAMNAYDQMTNYALADGTIIFIRGYKGINRAHVGKNGIERYCRDGEKNFSTKERRFVYDICELSDIPTIGYNAIFVGNIHLYDPRLYRYNYSFNTGNLQMHISADCNIKSNECDYVRKSLEFIVSSISETR